MNFTNTDIDECKEHNNCTNKQRCVNKPGSYVCLCKEGYHIDEHEIMVCVPDQPAVPPSSPPTGQSSLAIYLAVGEYIYCMFVFVPSDFPHRSRSCAIYNKLLHEVQYLNNGREQK